MSMTRANRPSREKPNKSQTSDHNSSSDTQGSSVKNQATAEQMRLAQMITTESNKGDDPVIKAKIQQVIELTGRSEDEALFALYDVNYDLNRAVEKLLESADTQNEWQEISKKKKSQQATKTEPVVNNVKSEGKREKSKDRDLERSEKHEQRSTNRRDRGPPRFQRGRGRDRGTSDGDNNERNSRMENSSGERNTERGERGGRGRGRGGGPGRGRGRGRGGFSRPNRFNENKERGPHIDTWTNEQAQSSEKENIGSWGDMAEDWTADDWQGSLEESKVFTPSVNNESNVFTSSSLNDNDAKMFTPPPLETQVFTATSLQNASISPTVNDTTSTYHRNSPLQTNSIPQGSMGHGSLGQNSLVQNSLGQNSVGSNALGQNSLGQNSIGQRLDLGTLFPKAAESSSPAQYSSSQQQSQFMSQYAKEATESIKNAVGIGSSAAGQQQAVVMPSPNDPSRSLNPAQVNQQRPKPQRSKLPPPSKIPASAVEMPGGMPQRNYQLDVQFGNLEFPSSMADNKGSGLGFGAPISSSVPGSVPNSYPSASVSVTPTKPTQPSSTGITALDNLSQTASQSPRGSSGVFPAANSTTTPPKDYAQTSLGQSASISSPPDSLSYPNSQDRKASPYSGPRGGQGSGPSKPASSPMTYSQSSYSSSSYQSASYNKPTHTSASSYSSHTPNGLTSLSSGLSSQSQYNTGSAPTGSASDSRGSSNTYQGSSFQTQPQYSSNQSAQSSLYPSSSNTYNSSQNPASYSNSSSVSSTSSSSYPSQSYQSQSAYSNQSYGSRGEPRDSINQSGSSVYQSGGSQSGSSYQTSVSSQASSYSNSQSAGQSGYNHQGYASSSTASHALTSANKLSDSLGKMSMKDGGLEGQSQYDGSASSSASLTTTTSTTSSSLASGSVSVSASLGISNNITTTASTAMSKNALPVTTTKAPPNLPPGVPLIQNYMTIGQPGIAPFAFASLAAGQQPIYSYEDLQLLQQRIPLNNGHFGTPYLDDLGHSYDMPLQPATSLPGRDQSAPLASAPYSTGSDSKLARVDAQSPVNTQTSQPQQPSQSATQQQQQQQQQAFINPTALPPGYNYYYPSGVLPGGYSYPPTMFPVPSVTNAAAHGISTASIPFQKPGGYGSHAYGTAGQNQDFSKTYSGVSTANNKASSGSMVSSSSGSDLTGTGTNYTKTHTQSFDKAGFHGGTPPPFNMPMPSGTQAGTMGAPTAYGAQYVPVISHQPHSQMMHHPLQQDSTGGSGRASQPLSSQNKPAVNKSYSAYWGTN